MNGAEDTIAHTGVPTPTGAHPHRSSTVGHAGHRVRFALRAAGISPALGLLAWGLGTGAALVGSWALGLFRSAASRQRHHERVVRRASRRLVALLGRLKGAFAKVGQFASTRHDLLPPGAAEALAGLRDQVPPLPFSLVREVVEDELGHPIDAVYSSFEREPIGAASVAQVHRATLPDGREVVAKVQYPWIRASLTSDLALIRFVAHAWVWLHGRQRWGADRDRLFDEFASGLREELDFVREGAVAGEIAANMAGDPQVVVPAVIPELTRTRVLTMTWQACVGVADRAALDRLGIDPASVLEVLARAYARQVFVDGHFHADPHPGNLFVLDEPGASERPRILFVDFGLSKQLDPALRRAMRQGIFAVLQRDAETFVARMDEMGMIAPGAQSGVRRAVDAMLERIALQAGQHGVLGASGAQVLALKDEAKRLLQETPGVQLPTELLFYAKTLSYLFALGEELDPEVDLMKISTPYLLQFLAGRD